MMEWVATIAGWLLILWGLMEVFIEVLFPRAQSAPLGGLLCQLSQRVAANMWRAGPGRRRAAISLVGPFLVTAQGDLVANSSGMRLLMVVQAAVGFSYFTLVLTYIMSVYGALATRNRIALSIDCATRCTGDPYVYLRKTLRIPRETALRTEDELAENLITMFESHQFYPVLHYFRFPEPAYALPRMLYFCMEVATVTEILQTADKPNGDERFKASGRLWHAANRLLTEAAENFSRRQLKGEKGVGKVTPFEDFLSRWQRSREGEPANLCGLTERYQELRERWLGPLQAVAFSQGAERMLSAQLQRTEPAETGTAER